jgi:hypothetical protein
MVNKGVMAILWIAILCLAFGFFLYIPTWTNDFWDMTQAPQGTINMMQLGFGSLMLFSVAMVVTTFIPD